MAQPLASCICFFSISCRSKYSHQETDTCTVISRVHCTLLAGAHQNNWIIPSLSHSSPSLPIFFASHFSSLHIPAFQFRHNFSLDSFFLLNVFFEAYSIQLPLPPHTIKYGEKCKPQSVIYKDTLLNLFLSSLS